MRINSQLIISERDKRAWSQQHLATVTGLALRTIQRIETNGSGSYESVTAIASCLGVSISELRASSNREQSLLSRPGIAKAAGSVVAASAVQSCMTSYNPYNTFPHNHNVLTTNEGDLI